MGVYTYRPGGFPISGGGGLPAGTILWTPPPGKWTRVDAEWTGTYTGGYIGGNAGVGWWTPAPFVGIGTSFASIPNTPGSFDCIAPNSPSGLTQITEYQGKQAALTFTMPSGYPSFTVDSVTLTLTGTLFGSPTPPGPLVRLLPTILGNLYFEEPVDSPLDLQPEAGPVNFPNYPLGPNSYETVWTPDGYVIVPKTGQFGNQRVRGRKKVACLRRKGHVYINIGPSNLPAIMQVSLPGDAQWLKFTPGLANLAAAAGNGNLGIRVYAGQSHFSTGIWTTNYTAPAVAPDWTGNGSYADLFPWDRPLQFLVEITGLAATIPAASLFEFCFDGFDLS